MARAVQSDTFAPRGFVLVTVLVWLSLLATLALGAALATMYEPGTSSAVHERARLRRAAESAATLAVLDLAARPDWGLLPAGGPASGFVDGAPGPRTIGGRAFDLRAETALRTCGRPTPCDDPSITTPSASRPWGAANPRWRLFAHLPLASLDPVAGTICQCYLVTWIADDPADGDGDPAADAPLGTPGHGVLMLRGAAFGAGGGVAEVEALVAQPCRISGAPCPGIRVQSWGAVGDSVP